ncbi:MBL fold metallo-hydrolase [Candidatus Uhrbacteria bacterium]|nr:MBL fold metallo-hydrolase [Candidatus Uhrbacteria bacterium]
MVMTIEKFLHSCLRVTHEGRRLLIDPGAFCFADGRVKPEQLGPVDVILLTHDHPDHFEPEALRTIVAAGTPIIMAHPPLAEKVRAAGLPCEDIAPGAKRTIAGFTIEAMETPHGPLTLPIPPHCGYLINDSLYHPGDSLVFPTGRTVETLALPVAGPWCTIVAAVDAAKALRPAIAFPIHDAIIQPFFTERLHWLVGKGFEGSGIEFRPVTLGTV